MAVWRFSGRGRCSWLAKGVTCSSFREYTLPSWMRAFQGRGARGGSKHGAVPFGGKWDALSVGGWLVLLLRPVGCGG